MGDKIVWEENTEKLKKSDETITFYNVKSEPFRVYGFCSLDGFKRIPTEVAEKSTVAGGNIELQYKRTAGGRIRFQTDSTRIAIKVKMPVHYIYSTRTQHMTCGFDLYVDRGRGVQFCAGLYPPSDAGSEFERIADVGEGKKEITLYFPLYTEVAEVLVGIDRDAYVEKARDYRVEIPVVFVGSSITQGANAPRPGLSYESIIERELGINYRNLGFAGAFRAQEALVDYVSGLQMSAFVLDYDHNAPTAAYLEETHYNVYQKIRENNPDIPVILVSKPDFRFERFSEAQRRAAVMDTYVKGIKNGDEKLYFVDGAAFFIGENRADCTEDTCHPNALGLKKMALHIGETVKNALKL